MTKDRMTYERMTNDLGALTKIEAVSQYGLKGCFLGDEAHAAVESHGRFVAVPYVEGKIMAALLAGVFLCMFIQTPADAFATGSLIYAQVVDIKCFDSLQMTARGIVLKHAETVAKHTTFLIDIHKDGSSRVGKNIFKFGGRVFGMSFDKQIGTHFGMHVIHLHQQSQNILDVLVFSFTNHSTMSIMNHVYVLESRNKFRACHGIHLGEGEQFLAEIFQRMADMVDLLVDYQETVVGFGVFV